MKLKLFRWFIDKVAFSSQGKESISILEERVKRLERLNIALVKKLALLSREEDNLLPGEQPSSENGTESKSKPSIH